MPPCRRAGAALPGRFAETLDSCPHRTTGFFFTVVGLDDNLDIFFPGKNPDLGLGRAPMPGRWRGREAPMPGRNVMLESTSGTCAFEVPRNWKQAPTIFWLLPAWSSELETGMSHFSELPAWSSAWSSPQSWGDNRIEGGNPGVTTGLKEAILQFFSLGIPWRGLGRAPMPGRWRGRGLCRAGMWRTRYRSRWASPYSLGEPSNKVGRASTKGPLGKPLNFHSGLHACFKAAPAWRGAYSACSARLVPARHV